MISTHEKFKILDLNGRPAAEVEVNWNPEDEKINKCKVLKFTYPDGTISYVDRKLLNELLFAIGRAEDQRKLIPQKITRVKWYETILSIKATKDIRKGEQITFPIKISMPAVEEEVIGEVAKSYHIPEKLKNRINKKVKVGI